METRNVKRKTNDRCAPLPKKWGRWICRCVCCQFFFWAVEDQRCGEALELGGHGHRNPPRCHADTRSDLDHDSGIPLQISTEIRTMYPNHVKRWGPHPERCPRLSRQAGQQGILTEPHFISAFVAVCGLAWLCCASCGVLAKTLLALGLLIQLRLENCSFLCWQWLFSLETEVEPENDPFEKENHLMKPSFLGSILFFRGVPEGHHVYTGYLHSLTTC